MGGLLRDLRHASAEQLVLRAAVVVCTALFVVMAALVGGHPLHDPWLVLIPVAAALLAAAAPHGPAPLVLLGWLVVVWMLTGAEPADLAVLPAAALLLMIHTGCALTAALPVRAAVPAVLWMRTLRRMGVVLTVLVLLWGGLRLLAPAAPVPDLWGTFSLTAGVSVVVAAVVAYDRWLSRRAAGQRRGF